MNYSGIVKKAKMLLMDDVYDYDKAVVQRIYIFYEIKYMDENLK